MEDKNKILQYERELFLLKDVIYDHYQESDDVVFRNLLSDPSTIKDLTPQSKRVPEESEELIMELTEEDVKDMTLKEKQDYIADRTLSVYNSYENCIKDVAFWVKRIHDKYSKEEAEVYLKEKRGPYVAEIQLNKEIGLLEKRYNKKGHANMLLYADTDWETNIIRKYGPFTINDFLKEFGDEKN